MEKILNKNPNSKTNKPEILTEYRLFSQQAVIDVKIMYTITIKEILNRKNSLLSKWFKSTILLWNFNNMQ